MIEKYLTIADLLFAIYGTTCLVAIYVIMSLDNNQKHKELIEKIELIVRRMKNE